MQKHQVNVLKRLFKDTNTTYLTLMKIMVPAIIVIKVLEELGIVKWLAGGLDPLMDIVGLPGEMGLVWATCIFANIYSALIIFFTQTDYSSFSVMQMSVLASMMLIVHALPIEGVITQKAGLKWIHTIILRIGGAFLFGFLTNYLCSSLGLLQQPVTFEYIPLNNSGQNLWEWALEQLYGLALLYFVLLGLIILLKVMNKVGINRMLEYLMAPVLGRLGISNKATYMTLIGMTLGLAYGGGLLIYESKKDTLSKKDILLSICLISLFHSIIEDTLVVLIIGPNLWVILFFRLLYALAIVYAINKLAFASEKRGV